MDENQLQLVKDALKTVELYKDNPAGFMKKLVENQFFVGNKKTIWDHFNTLTSLSPTFRDRYTKTVLRDYKVPNKRFWKDYVGKIENFIYYMAQVPGEQSVVLDRALTSFAQTSGLTTEQLAYLERMQATPIQQRTDMIDQFLKSGQNGQKSPYSGYISSKPTKGIEGSKSIINERKIGLEGSKSIVSERKILTGPEEIPLTTGMETFQASNTPVQSGYGKSGSFFRRILHPSPKVIESIDNSLLLEGEHQLKMGLIKGLPALEDAAQNFGGEVLKEFGSIPALSGEPKETIIFNEPQETTYPSSGGGRFSPGGRSIRTVRNIPRTIKRTKKGITGSRLAGTAVKQIATKNPYVWIAGLAALFIFLLFFGGSDSFRIIQNTALCGLPNTPCGKTPSQIVETQNIVALLKTCDPSVTKGALISCNISATYTGPGVASFEISDTVPTGTVFQSYFPIDPAISKKVGEVITWTVKDIPTNTPQFFYLTYTAPDQDVWVPNTATVKVLSTSINPYDINTPPNQDNCNGKWGPNSFFGRFPQNGNFGDPNCDFTKDALLALLREQDPINADYWFDVVVRCESGYDPNAFLRASTSGKGAYGLFQMNPTGQGNGPLDAGNVVWQRQVSNAVGYERLIADQGLSWRYWACAISRW